MPSKRDPAKQRRQAQNRAARQAREARRAAANRPPEDRAPARSAASRAAGQARPQRPRGGAFAGRPPGYRAAFLALLFSIGALASVALNQPEVDEDGRAYSFTEVAEREDLREEQREAGEDELPRETRNGLAAAWPFTPLLLLPVGVGALAVRVGQRAGDPTRAWMRCMFATAVFALLAASIPPGYTILYFPMVIALTVATFQSRKATTEAAAAAAAAQGGPAVGGVIEATATDGAPEAADDRAAGDTGRDETGRDETGRDETGLEATATDGPDGAPEDDGLDGEGPDPDAR